MKFREYKVAQAAIKQARLIGLFGDTAKRLMRAARRSAPFTSDFGNRRFQDFVLTVQDSEVVWIERL